MRFYRALLHLYPASFRAEYGTEMCSVFSERRRSTSGLLAVLGLWIETVFDVLFNAVQVHWDLLRQDLRYAARTFRRAPAFALTAILLVGLGVGATTAVFTITDHVLIRPLPFTDPDRLVKLWENRPPYTHMSLSPPNYRDWKNMSTVFESMEAYRGLGANMSWQGQPQRVGGASISAGLFPMLGVQPMLGRMFDAADDRDGAPGTLLLSYRLWQAAFGGDAGVVGKKILLDNAPYIIIGVLPRDSYFPSPDAELWTAMRFAPADFEDRNNNYVQVIARLKHGVTLEQAREGMGVITAQLERAYPRQNAHTGATLAMLRDEVSTGARLALLVLFGGALCVLLIACTNLANLLMARALTRQKEIAVRTSLGAGRVRIVRQLLTESFLLAILGGLCGVFVAAAALPLLMRLVPQSLPIAPPSIDLRVMIFAVVLTGLTGLGFGVVPALRACGKTGIDALREGSRAGVSLRKERLRSALVILEVAASVVLLISSGLLIRALWKIQAVDPGFRADGVLTLRTALTMSTYGNTARRNQFYDQVLSQVRAVPGVSNAAYVSFLPMIQTGAIWPITVEGQSFDPSQIDAASMLFVTPDFFTTMGIPLHAGRDVSESDTLDSLPVAVVSESFAHRYWPNENPLGRRFHSQGHGNDAQVQFISRERAIVGVVGDIRVRGLERSSEPQVYLPYKQMPDNILTWQAPKDLAIRSSLDPGTLLPAVRRIIQSADAEQPIFGVQMMTEIVESGTEFRRAQARALAAFAMVAFLLAGIGIHGLLSFTVSSRTQEIGVRIALGAQRSNILSLVLRESAALALMGTVFGLALGYAAGRILESILAGVKPGDATTLVTAVALTLLMTMVGSFMPAVRALRVDPVKAIRAE